MLPIVTLSWQQGERGKSCRRMQLIVPGAPHATHAPGDCTSPHSRPLPGRGDSFQELLLSPALRRCGVQGSAQGRHVPRPLPAGTGESRAAARIAAPAATGCCFICCGGCGCCSSADAACCCGVPTACSSAVSCSACCCAAAASMWHCSSANKSSLAAGAGAERAAACWLGLNLREGRADRGRACQCWSALLDRGESEMRGS